jgi:rSAM/selenodomain-associated transferase 2
MISIIIPTFNEAKIIEPLISYLQKNIAVAAAEIIISDGGSTDNTIKAATNAGATVVLSPLKGRAAQMNFGASMAKGSILYFLHADCFPPTDFIADIHAAIDRGFEAGRYQTRFTGSDWRLIVNAFFTRFDLFVCYGGDQTLFVTRQLFTAIGGYDESRLIMEDYDITHRIKQQGRYEILPGKTLVSTRKYQRNGWWAVQKANYKAIKMYKNGVASKEIASMYKNALS